MSLLLDALKKAAEEKLANKETNDDSTAVDSTEVAGATESTVADGQSMDETSIDYDATMVDHTGMPPESTIADNSEQDLTSFDFEPVDHEEIGFDDTEVGNTKSTQEPTELEAITGVSTQNTQVYTDIDSEETVIGLKEDHAIDLEEVGVDVTEVREQPEYETAQYQNATMQKTSLTDNFLKQGYKASPEAAEKIMGVSSTGGQSKLRLFALLGLVFLVGIGVLGLFAYQYYMESRDVDYKLSYQQYKTKRKVQAENIEKNNSVSSDKESVIQDEIVVAQKDYVSLLDKEFNAIENQQALTSEKKVVRQAVSKPSKPVKPKSRSRRAIKIQKVQYEPVSNIVMQGYNAFNDGDISAAKQHYTKALQRKANNRDAKLGLAAIAITEGQNALAREIYVELLQENPSDPIALAGLTTLGPVSQNQNTQNTLSNIKLMLEQQPESADLHFALGNLYADAARWPEAQKAFFNAYSIESDNPDYLYNLAVSLDYMGKQEAALPFYQQALVQSGLRQSNIPVAAAEQRIAVIQQKK